MGKLSDIRSDPDAMLGGVWVPFEAGIQLKIARLWNENHSRCMAQLSAEHINELRAGRATETRGAMEERIMREAIARTVLLDWKNLEDDEGKPIPYSPEKALEFFNDRRYRDFYDFIVDTASQRQLYREKAKRDAVKN